MSAASDTSIPFGCLHCAIPFDRPGFPKRLRCSRCGTSYCSQEHQRLDWPRHRKECAKDAKSGSKLEEHVLASPSMAAMIKDFTDNRDDLFPEIIVAVRSALLIGKPGQRHSTSVLTLQFQWHPHKSGVRRRFVLEEVALYSMAQMIDLSDSVDPETAALLREPMPHAPAGMLVWPNFIRLMNSTTGKNKNMVLPHSISFGMFDSYIPAAQRSIDDDWAATLMRGLSRPEVRSWKTLNLEDLLRTEGMAKTKRAIFASPGVPRTMMEEDFQELQRLEKEMAR